MSQTISRKHTATSCRWLAITFLLLISAGRAASAETTLHLEGDVPARAETRFFVPLEVPDGIAEIEVRHDDLSEANILDWGLDDPNGFRGWGGGNASRRSSVSRRRRAATCPVRSAAGRGRSSSGRRRSRAAGALRGRRHLRDTATLAPQSERTPYAAPAPRARRRVGTPATFTCTRARAATRGRRSTRCWHSPPAAGSISSCSPSTTPRASSRCTHAAQAQHPGRAAPPGGGVHDLRRPRQRHRRRQWVDHRIGVRGATIEDAIGALSRSKAPCSRSIILARLGDLCIGCGWEHVVDPNEIDGVESPDRHRHRRDLLGEGWSPPGLARGGARRQRRSRRRHGDGPFDSPIGSPTTMVYAKELSVAAILEGVRDARTVVKLDGPDGPMVDTEASGRRRGDIVYATHRPCAPRSPAATV